MCGVVRVLSVSAYVELELLEEDGVSSDHQATPLEPFDVFFRREQRGLVALGYVLTGSKAAAEDLAQDAMIAASRQWGRVGRLENPTAWVRRAVANRSMSLIRRRINDSKVVARLAVRQQPSLVNDDLPSESAHIWALVRRLPRRQAQVVTLSALHRLSLAEIGEVLELSKETVQTHLRRARETLSAQLEQGTTT